MSDKSRSGPPASDQQTFFPDPAVDRLTTTVLRLTEEVWVLTERLAIAEALARRRGALEEGEMDAVQFSSAEDEKIRVARGRFIRRVLGPLSRTGSPK